MTYNLSWIFGDEWLEFLIEYGYGCGDGGLWYVWLVLLYFVLCENVEDCLMWLVLHGFVGCVRMLLVIGVDFDGCGICYLIFEGRMVFEFGLCEGHVDVVRLLCDAGVCELELDE